MYLTTMIVNVGILTYFVIAATKEWFIDYFDANILLVEIIHYYIDHLIVTNI